MKRAVFLLINVVYLFVLTSCNKTFNKAEIGGIKEQLKNAISVMDINLDYEKEKNMNNAFEYKKDIITTIKLGSYIQDNLDIKEPIEWIVLEKDGDKALLLCKKVIERHSYNDDFINVTWRESLVRYWLNTDFYNEAFTDEEKVKILDVNILNEDNNSFDTQGGENTVDSIFLLSINEAYKYFICKEAMSTVDTVYARKGGVSTRTCWLRSPGDSQNKAAIYPFWIEDWPKINERQLRGDNVFLNLGIRPAMWVKY